MQLTIGTADDGTWIIHGFSQDTLMDFIDALNDKKETFHQFDFDGRMVWLNKRQIVSVEVE